MESGPEQGCLHVWGLPGGAQREGHEVTQVIHEPGEGGLVLRRDWTPPHREHWCGSNTIPQSGY